MRYDAKEAISCLLPGVYDATVEAAVESTSKTGKAMVVFTFRVYKPSGGDVALKDYVVNPNGLWRLKKLAKAIGKSSEFDSGVFRESDYVGANLKLDLEVEEDEQYGDKNRIKAWLPKDAKPNGVVATPTPGTVARNSPIAHTPIQEEDIPF